MDSPSDYSFFDKMPRVPYEMILHLLPGAALVKARAIDRTWCCQCTDILFERMAKLLCTLYDVKEELGRRRHEMDENDKWALALADANWLFIFWLFIALEAALKVFYHEETHPDGPFLYGTVSKKSFIITKSVKSQFALLITGKPNTC
jgi:hypothetical protein